MGSTIERNRPDFIVLREKIAARRREDCKPKSILAREKIHGNVQDIG
jgi:hypothetical protein